MSKLHKICIVALTASALSTAATAGGAFDQDRAYGRIQAERERQESLVEAGRRDGSITFMEKLSIRREQSRVNKLERDALADGRLDRHEVHAIREAQDGARRHIAAERSDAQVRGWWWRLWR